MTIIPYNYRFVLLFTLILWARMDSWQYITRNSHTIQLYHPHRYFREELSICSLLSLRHLVLIITVYVRRPSIDFELSSSTVLFLIPTCVIHLYKPESLIFFGHYTKSNYHVVSQRDAVTVRETSRPRRRKRTNKWAATLDCITRIFNQILSAICSRMRQTAM